MDDYGKHEVLDRISVSLAQFHSFVVEHAVVESLSDEDPVKAAVLAAEKALVEAYQAAGIAYL